MYVNRGKLKEAGVDPDTDLSIWEKVGPVLDTLKAAGVGCPLTAAWQSWVHLESLPAYRDVPFASKSNGFSGLDAGLSFNGPLQVAPITAMGQWAKDGKFLCGGRRNEAGANFRSGECAIFTENSAGYAGVKNQTNFAGGYPPVTLLGQR